MTHWDISIQRMQSQTGLIIRVFIMCMCMCVLAGMGSQSVINQLLVGSLYLIGAIVGSWIGWVDLLRDE